MKKLLLSSVFVAFLFGCQDPISLPEDLKSNIGKEEFVEPETSEYSTYLKPIREYMYHRTQAVLKNDINLLWEQYPDLKNNSDRKTGVNIEKYEIESLNDSFNLLDANFSIESYERIKVKKITENEVIVLVHGSISYLRKDLDESGGEYLIEVYLQKRDNQWTVIKTDEYLEHEYKEWLEEKEK
ncbi:hypothetical protein SAMN05880501_106149 [Ureibacillus xyleni]|uniref:Lipoprotein n=1 Tax=Ureibacillus xyleni TaxID=614648 RepID=A0A285SXT9_9BACL|nr:hypothetical protein [Ureibacillus xyleni]SOC11412.1 hypothetical protein SAMN05880501_106149 [Ureibacillus xyleni]